MTYKYNCIFYTGLELIKIIASKTNTHSGDTVSHADTHRCQTIHTTLFTPGLRKNEKIYIYTNI